MWQLVRTPKTQLGIMLFLIFLSAFIHNPSLKLLLLYFILQLTAFSSDLFLLKIRGIPLFFPSAALVSASIITLIVNPNLSWYQLLIIVLLAIVSKNFLRISGRHIFNPAGFGLLAGSLIFPNAISWWGVSFQQFFPQSGISLRETIPFFILLSPALISIVRMRRHQIIFSFLITYALLSSISNFKFQISNFFDPTLLFFSLVMLPEPMTTPNRRTQQILFGGLVAIFSFFLFSPTLNSQLSTFNSLDPLILSLLIGNLLFFRFK